MSTTYAAPAHIRLALNQTQHLPRHGSDRPGTDSASSSSVAPAMGGGVQASPPSAAPQASRQGDVLPGSRSDESSSDGVSSDHPGSEGASSEDSSKDSGEGASSDDPSSEDASEDSSEDASSDDASKDSSEGARSGESYDGRKNDGSGTGAWFPVPAMCRDAERREKHMDAQAIATRCANLDRVRGVLAREYRELYDRQMGLPVGERRYFVSRCGYCGVGNKIRCVTSGFVYAILTNRLFVMDIPFLHEVYADPFGGTIKWRFSELHGEFDGIPESDMANVELKKLFQERMFGRRLLIYGDCAPTYNRLETKGPAEWHRRLNEWFPEPQGLDVVYELGNTFFGALTAESERAMATQKQKLQWDKYRLKIGVHIRRCVDCGWTGHADWLSASRYQAQLKCVHDKVADIQQRMHVTPSETLLVYATDKPTDYSTIAKRLVKTGVAKRTAVLQTRDFYKRGFIHQFHGHTRRGEKHPGFFNSEFGATNKREEHELMKVMMDLLLLGETDTVVTTGTSFGYFGGGRNMLPLVYTQHKNFNKCDQRERHEKLIVHYKAEV